jgi:hypothetical protein
MIQAELWAGDIGEPSDTDDSASASGLLAAVDVHATEETYPLLTGIDAYGDTVFNAIQLPRLIVEMQRLLALKLRKSQHNSVEQVIELAERRKSSHSYLVFFGD